MSPKTLTPTPADSSISQKVIVPFTLTPVLQSQLSTLLPTSSSPSSTSTAGATGTSTGTPNSSHKDTKGKSKAVTSSSSSSSQKASTKAQTSTKSASTLSSNIINVIHTSTPPGDNNSALEVYWQCFAPFSSPNTATANTSRVTSTPHLQLVMSTYIDLLEHILQEPLFNTLRTKKQLGYSVGCASRFTHGVHGEWYGMMRCRWGRFVDNSLSSEMNLYSRETVCLLFAIAFPCLERNYMLDSSCRLAIQSHYTCWVVCL